MNALALGLLTIALQILLLILASLFILRAMVQIISSKSGVPFVRTPLSAFVAIEEALQVGPGDLVYELGSGDGSFVRWCAARHPDARLIGVELNPLLVRYARWRAARSGLHNLEFIQGNVFDSRFHEVTKIYAYMFPIVLDALLPRLQEEFRGRLVSRAFQFAEKPSSAVIELAKRPGMHGQHRLYLYDFPAA
jgi:hypothetical protein